MDLQEALDELVSGVIAARRQMVDERQRHYAHARGKDDLQLGIEDLVQQVQRLSDIVVTDAELLAKFASQVRRGRG